MQHGLMGGHHQYHQRSCNSDTAALDDTSAGNYSSGMGGGPMHATYSGGGAGTAAAGPEKVQICFDFTKGTCTRGDKCKYSHDIATIVHFNSREKGICFDYLRNQCHRGLLCRFSHDLSNIAQQCQVCDDNGGGSSGTATPAASNPVPESAPAPVPAPASAPEAAAGPQRRATSICYDFVKGVCQRGTECRYSHDLSLIARTSRGGGPAGGAQQPTDICYDFLRWAFGCVGVGLLLS